jgi:hypothetical protein
MEKLAAATDWKLTDRPVLAFPSVRDQEAGERVKLARQKAAQAEEADRMEAVRVQNQILDGFAKLADYFNTPGNLTLADVRENIETLFGKAGVAVYNQLRRTRSNLTKQAATGWFHSATGEPYHTVSRLVDLAGRLRQVVGGNEKRVADRGAALEEIERPFVSAPRGSLLDPPPTWALGEALLVSKDRALKLRIIKVPVALAAVDQVRVVYILCEAFKQRQDLEVKRVAAVALLVLTERSGPSPSPPERPAPDPQREEYARDRGKSSSERVDQ